jgi:hypothetical protein
VSPGSRRSTLPFFYQALQNTRCNPAIGFKLFSFYAL